MSKDHGRPHWSFNKRADVLYNSFLTSVKRSMNTIWDCGNIKTQKTLNFNPRMILQSRALNEYSLTTYKINFYLRIILSYFRAEWNESIFIYLSFKINYLSLSAWLIEVQKPHNSIKLITKVNHHLFINQRNHIIQIYALAYLEHVYIWRKLITL